MELISLSIFLGLLLFSSSIFYLAKAIIKKNEYEKELNKPRTTKDPRISINYNGKEYSINKLAKELGIGRSQLYNLYYKGDLYKYLNNDYKGIKKYRRPEAIENKKFRISNTIPDKFLIKYGLKRGEVFENTKELVEKIGVSYALPWDWRKKKYIEIIK